MKEAIKMALDYLNDHQMGDHVRAALEEALAKQEHGEPVACFDWLPEGATHLTQIKVNIKSGGRLEMRAHVFKYDNEVLMVYATDNDNEYPEWREAKECFFHLNFPVFSVPAPPAAQPAPQQRTWVGLTPEEVKEISLANRPYVVDMVVALEARLKEKNNG